MGKRGRVFVFVLALLLALPAAAQNRGPSDRATLSPSGIIFLDESSAPLNLDAPAPRPRMAPELALDTYLEIAHRQLSDLGAFSDMTVIVADLPETSQHGRYELQRRFSAPKSLAYAAIRFAGDGFIKTNVIARMLQSEVDHVQKGEGARTAIIGENYKFSFKGTDSIDDRPVYVFQLKPRQKRPGLFKGRIYVDAVSGRLRRAEGVMVKSPSFFVKRVEFIQDYGNFGSFSLPVHVHSIAKTRIFGRAVVDVSHSAYQAKSIDEMQADTTTSVTPAFAPGTN